MRRPLAAAALAALAGCMNAQPCPGNLEVCNGACVDLAADPEHCGACGTVCASGKACVSGACTDFTTGSCANRTNGAFVVLESCGQTVKLWTTSATFISQAQVLLSNPASTPNLPVLQLTQGADCDAQWTWHPDAIEARFEPGPPDTQCSLCPGSASLLFAYTPIDPLWCPPGSSVLSVDVR